MSELSGRELDRAIAVELGWRVMPRVDGHYDLISPTNRIVALVQGANQSVIDDDAIAYCWSRIPEYHADANAVLAVCAERGWAMIFEPNGRVCVCAKIVAGVIWDGHRFSEHHYWGDDGATPQEAGARALLAALTSERDSAEGT